MKTQQHLKKSFISAVFAIAVIFDSSTVFAQLKIGTNPTTIEPSSSLEVEGSTAGRKMKVDKTTGKVSIADGTEGSGKVFTSDAVGGGSWQATGPSVYMEANNTGSQTVVGASDFNRLVMPNEVADIGNNYNPATSQFTVPTTGYYMVMARTTKTQTSNTITHSLSLSLLVNGSGPSQYILDALPDQQTGVGGNVHFQATAFGLFNAGDVLELSIRSSGVTPNAVFIMNSLKIIKLF
jgi:hypothetical protein